MSRDYADPEYRARLSEAARRRNASPEYRARHAEGIRKRNADPEYRARHAEALADPEYRARMAEALRRVNADPEYRQRKAEGTRRSWRSEARARRMAIMASPEHRAAAAARARGNRHVLDAPVIGECVYCGAPARERDHIISRRSGGSDHPDNLAPCCRSCNASKGDRDPWTWLADGLRRT